MTGIQVIYLIAAIGFGAGLIAVLIALAFQRAARNRRLPRVPAGFAGLTDGPAGLISQVGQRGRVHRSLDQVVMRPTVGARLWNLSVLAALWWVMLGENGAQFRSDPILVALALCVTVAVTLFLVSYEVRYDGEGVTAPKWLVHGQTHRWEDLISVSDAGHHIYKLRFETGTANINKYLVGMPTFITFISDIRDLIRRR